MSNNILCTVGYLGGTHGTFLAYFLDKYSRRTPNIESSPFDKKSGTAHSKSINYSGKFDRRTFEDEQGKVDHLIDDKLLVHKMNELYLTGIEVDYNSEIFGSTFTFNNPVAKSQCGCGTSFSI